jgi:hypothetical protein
MDVHTGLLLTMYQAALSVPRTNHASVTPVLVLYAVSAGLAVVWPPMGVNPKAPSNATYTVRLVPVTDTQVASEFAVATVAWAAVGPVPSSSRPPTRVKAEAHPAAPWTSR